MATQKILKLITQTLLLSVIAIVPFLKTTSLYFPFVSGKVYVFRGLVMLAFFFWVWLTLKAQSAKRKAQNNECKAQNPFSIFKNVLVIAVVLFFLAQVLVSFFGVDPLYSIFSSIERADGVLQYGFWALYFLILISVFKKEQDWKMLFSVFVIVAVLISVYSWLRHDSQPQLFGIFGNPAYFAAFLLFAMGFSLLMVERRFFNSRLLNGFLLLTAGFLTFTLIFTKVRGAYAGFAGGIFLFSILSILFLRKERRKLAIFCGVILLLGFTSLTLLFSARETDFVKSQQLLSRVTEVTKIWESGSVRERLLNWNIALKAFKEKPIFGYGPENFGSAANKYYDYRIGREEPWFDRAHNNPFEILATGGIVLFSFYLFWLAVVFYIIFKVAKEEKVLSFILASIFLAYFLQGFFLFDLLAVYLGLFPFLAFLVYLTRINADTISANQPKSAAISGHPLYILVPVGLLSLFIIYATVFVPYKANAAALKFFALTENGFYKEAKPFLEEAFNVKSPYTFWEVRKRAGWQFVGILEYEATAKMPAEKIKEIEDIYDFIAPELEKFIKNKPYEPQMYYVLARTYRFGFEKLGKDDLEKAEIVLRKAFDRSDLRVDYFNEFGQVLLLQGRFEEAEKSVRDYAQRVAFYEYFPYLTLGHFYFVAEKHNLALEQYEKARKVGYKFYENSAEYSRYMLVAEEAGEYQKVVDMAKLYLERWGEDADTYFNIAVGYLNLKDKEKAREFFLKALALNKKYEEYKLFFEDSFQKL